jgi:DNA-binding transcriptional MerR regulator
MSIGEVLTRLRPEFPEVSISKIRFLEAEGLIDPERTASGYRKFSYADLERLRYILGEQRDKYFPLKVIKEHLDLMARGLEPPDVAGEAPRAPRAVQAVPDEVDAAQFAAPIADLRITRVELAASSGLSVGAVDDLVSFGLLKTRPGTEYFDAEAVVVATTAAQLAAYGLEPRHLRAFKAAADREVGLIDQIVSPQARQRDDQARARAAEMESELAALSVRLHATLVKIGLRRSR